MNAMIHPWSQSILNMDVCSSFYNRHVSFFFNLLCCTLKVRSICGESGLKQLGLL